MKFLREMLARKSASKERVDYSKTKLDPELAARAAVDAMKVSGDDAGDSGAKLSDIVGKLSEAPEAKGSEGVNIWDLEDDGATPAASQAPAAPKRRPARNKTRLLGFEPQDRAVVELFEANAQPAAPVVTKFAVGWLVVVDGPGRGASFPVMSGMSQIGRGSDQTIPLDFGDSSISRSNHAALAYDSSDHKFHLGHGGKSNLVRLNDKPLLSTEEIKDNDEFLIGETTLRLRTFCGPDFNWDNDKSEGDDHVAIA